MNNLIFVGKMASGKTYKIFRILDETIKKGEHLIIFDAKQEYISKFSESLNKNNYKQYVINFEDFENSNCYNPLEYPYKLYKKGKKDEAYSVLEKFGKTIFSAKNAMDEFWINSATHLFIGLVLGLFEDANEDQINLNSVWNMLSCFDEKYGASDYVSKYVKTKGENNAIYNTLSSIIFSPTDTKGGIISTAREKLQIYINRINLLQIISKSEINFENILDEKIAIIIIPNSKNPNINNMPVAILEQLIDIFYDRKEKTQVILDDFDMIDKLNDLEHKITYGPSNNIEYIIVTKSKELLYEKYGKYLENVSEIIECNDKYDAVEVNQKDIDYPKLKIENINIFDLKKHISMIDEEQYSDIKNEEKFEMKDLLKNINDKLKELD